MLLACLPVLIVLCGPLACDRPRGSFGSSATTSSPAPPSTSAERPPAPLTSSAPPVITVPSRALYGASAESIEAALRSAGWAPAGHRVGSIKGVKCTTVLARRDGKRAEVRSFEGYPYLLQDMLELKGSAQGIAEMTMITVLVEGDAAMTDGLYEQLMGSAPMRHGSGLGLPQNRDGGH